MSHDQAMRIEGSDTVKLEFKVTLPSLASQNYCQCHVEKLHLVMHCFTYLTTCVVKTSNWIVYSWLRNMRWGN